MTESAVISDHLTVTKLAMSRVQALVIAGVESGSIVAFNEYRQKRVCAGYIIFAGPDNYGINPSHEINPEGRSSASARNRGLGENFRNYPINGAGHKSNVRFIDLFLRPRFPQNRVQRRSR